MVEPTLDEWGALYRAAVALRDQAPWTWLGNDDLFAVEHPDFPAVGYCDVMGMGGEEFGLAVFLDADGFAFFRGLMLGTAQPEGDEILTQLHSLAATFDDREALDQRDRDVIRALNLRFRGRGAWPLFRSQRPGYFPWYLDQDEARFLTHALEQAVIVAQRALDGNLTLTAGVDGEEIFTRGFRDGSWHDAWRPAPAAPAAPQEEVGPVDEVRLQRVRATKQRGKETWQLDVFVLPAPIQERGERPYLPYMLLAANQQGLIVGNEMLEQRSSAKERQDAVIAMLEQAPELPRVIRVGRPEVERLVAPVGRALGIRTQVGRIALLQEAKAELVSYLGGGL
jgi:hypothetical protein